MRYHLFKNPNGGNTNIETLDQKLETLSDKYKLVPTRLIADKFKSLGFVVDNYTENRVRKASKQGFQKHQVRLSNPTLLNSTHSDLKIQLIVSNSHDGLSSLNIQLGIYRLVCSNGMMAGTMFESISLRHTGKILEQIDESVMRIVAQVSKLDNMITALKNTQLTLAQQTQFMSKAIKLRYDDKKTLSDVDFPIHREEDRPLDAFTFFNKIQESLIRGGNQVVNDKGKVRTARAITSINTANLINTGLFDLISEYLPVAA